LRISLRIHHHHSRPDLIPAFRPRHIAPDGLHTTESSVSRSARYGRRGVEPQRISSAFGCDDGPRLSGVSSVCGAFIPPSHFRGNPAFIASFGAPNRNHRGQRTTMRSPRDHIKFSVFTELSISCSHHITNSANCDMPTRPLRHPCHADLCAIPTRSTFQIRTHLACRPWRAG